MDAAACMASGCERSSISITLSPVPGLGRASGRQGPEVVPVPVIEGRWALEAGAAGGLAWRRVSATSSAAVSCVTCGTGKGKGGSTSCTDSLGDPKT